MALLENDLIRLRALEPEDLDALFRWENDSDLWAYGSALAPYSKFALREYISEARHDIFQSRQLRLMIVLKENDSTAGAIDLYDFDPMNLRAGVGILLDSAHRGKGLGFHVLKLLEDYAFNFLFLKQLYAYIPQKNTASMKLFTRCGYKQTACLNQWLKCGDHFENVNVLQLINPKSTSPIL
ncbi:MAG: GNAT family N-acetyltransferase [Dysgonamonadaceae bacterium]|jgi:diamine N-acetyltransferase|nr:GNAT family N-acetyltransferase [Dysgonamonadaceae bacterium]